ncbi:hypothetical protein [Krasilnikovia sp. MM14-A1259]|uniref:hypothetical protein n=1 Tax=Krasilnikovia sp. MM14-A1259 TaxID=3373539 RepID=UPI003830112D
MTPARRRATTAAVLSGTASALWFAPAVMSPYADLSVETALVGLVPIVLAFGGLGVAHLAGALRMVDTRTRHQAQPERGRKVLR